MALAGMRYLADLDEREIDNVLATWQAAHPYMGVLALLPEAEKDTVAGPQAACARRKVPLVGAVFPALVEGEAFHTHGVPRQRRPYVKGEVAMDTVTAVLWFSVALQATAAVTALRLIPLSGHATAWILFSVVFLLMAARRLISLLYDAGVIEGPERLPSMIEPVALVISILLVIAVYLTRRVFVELAQSRSRLERQLDELRRFQQTAVGRELRLKELEEENTRLKTHLDELQRPAT